MKVELYDTTLRDGAQGERITFSSEDQLLIAQLLDNLGIDYIEGGQPASNPKAVHFFKQVKQLNLKNARPVAFGGTCHPRRRVQEDESLRKLLDAGTRQITIVGKSWDFHVHKVLGVSLNKNLSLIDETIRFLISHGREVFFDAEHFFDGCKENPNYALSVLKAAEKAGAARIILCDTNGGSMLDEVSRAIDAAKKAVSVPLGIHVHNDSGLATANTLLAVQKGISQIQGTINGYGERCGNADLCIIIPNLCLKMGIPVVAKTRLQTLREVSHYVSELANITPRTNQPYVGYSAFAHKGGWHADAVGKDPRTCEHVPPESVGNHRRILVSEVAGKGSLASKANSIGIKLKAKDALTQQVVQRLKELEQAGYQFEGADASLELLMHKTRGTRKNYFRHAGFRVIVEKREDNQLTSEATIKVIVDGKGEQHTAAEGNGPVNALDNALRKALEPFYGQVREMHLSDFKVRILDAKAGTQAKTRVLIESRDKEDTWNTVGVDENIIEASWQALVDSIEYKLMKDERAKKKSRRKDK
ncbi:MAG: citramalate synthase [Candidatus Abyssobacteria bacterium SURF_5]|uniref:Citramalate synthase n=1 Tax=Abyssobacteria bacterium (strain SURF_5) TaxID=2093360 RepID=A0A3A4NR47_ABYX5|nr:MAG: citramalate synthase [Candidatus Abyssubacteria bacterium SURF_5]